MFSGIVVEHICNEELITTYVEIMSTKKPDRRIDILNAVISLLADKGVAGLTHRAVDAAASIPQGSTTYYFPKKLDLLRAAASHLAKELENDCSALQIGFAEVVAKQGLEGAIDHVAQELIASSEQAKHLTLARIELTLAAARDPELEEMSQDLTKAAQRPLAFFLDLISEGNNEVPIGTFVGLIDGISLMHATGQGQKPTAEQLKTVFRALVNGSGKP